MISDDEIMISELKSKIKKIMLFLKSQLIYIIIMILIGCLSGYFYAIRQDVNYYARLTFVLEEGKSASSGLGGLASLAGQFGVDVGSSGGNGLMSGENILLYLKTESLTREVLLSKLDSNRNKTFADFYSEVYGLKNIWKKKLNIDNISFQKSINTSQYSRLYDSLIQTITKSILKDQLFISKVDKKASFIEVKCLMKDEKLANIYCQKVVQIAVKKYIELKTQRQTSTVEKLQKRVDSIGYLLSKKTITGASLLTTTSTMDINPLYKTNTSVANETTIRDKTMLATIFASVTQNLEIAKFTLSQETPVIQIVDEPRYPLAEIKTSKSVTMISFSFGFVLLFISFKIMRMRLVQSNSA